ncbi:MAG: hypothetical protein AAF617_06215 [Bacteroidota bacterium]
MMAFPTLKLTTISVCLTRNEIGAEKHQSYTEKLNRRKTYFFIALSLTVSVALLLVTGSFLLTLSLGSASIPLGTFITWIGMISFPLTIYFGIKELQTPSNTYNKILSKLLKTIILLGILWVPISYLLAGNLSFTFSETQTFQGGQVAMKWFWYLSYSIGIGAICTLFAYWISLLFKKII